MNILIVHAHYEPQSFNAALKDSAVETLAEDIRLEVEKVQWCDRLILNFPIFWFSAPAILKGWIDRVFVSGRFYGGKRFYDQGGMRGKQAMLSVTLGGQPHMFGPEAIPQ